MRYVPQLNRNLLNRANYYYCNYFYQFIIPAKAGIYIFNYQLLWIPASAGMTVLFTESKQIQLF